MGGFYHLPTMENFPMIQKSYESKRGKNDEFYLHKIKKLLHASLPSPPPPQKGISIVKGKVKKTFPINDKKDCERFWMN